MNTVFAKPAQQSRASYWGTNGPGQSELLARIHEVGPILDSEADESEAQGKLTRKAYDALATLRPSHFFVPESLGGAQHSPTRGLELLEAISYHSGSAGWVAMVYASIGAMSAGYLPEPAAKALFGEGKENRFAGQGAPLGMLKRTEGGYLLNGRWGYGSGFHYATWSHSAAFLDDGTGKPAVDEKGNPIVLCAHAPMEQYEDKGNWDVLGLRATGSVDHVAEDVFIGEDYVYPILTARPQRLEEFYSVGVIGLASIGHSGWAIGVSRRALDELAAFARTKTGRAGLIGESEHFWVEFARHEGRVRAARAFLFEAWRDIERTMESGQAASTRQISLLHLAKIEVHDAGADAIDFAYRSAGGTSLRRGILQRVFREMYTATQHITVSTGVMANVGRDLLGIADGYVWQFHDLKPGDDGDAGN